MSTNSISKTTFPAGTDIVTHRLLAFNIDQMKSIIPEISISTKDGLHHYNHQKIIKGLFLYLSENLIYDLWKFAEIDLNTLCKDYINMDKSNLNRRMNNPYQRREIEYRLREKGMKGEELEKQILEEIELIKNSKDDYYYETLFEDVLYQLLTRVVKLKLPKVITKNEIHIDHKSQLFIERVRIIVDTTGRGRGRKRYLIEPTKFFFDSLNKSWLFQNAQASKQLLGMNKKDTAVYDLYLYINSLKEESRRNNLQFAKPNFDRLCKIANIEHYKEDKRKKHKLNEYLETIQSTCAHLNLTIKWSKRTPESNYSYQVLLYFEQPETPTDKGNYWEQKKMFMDNTYRAFGYYAYLERHGQQDNINKDHFNKWLYSLDHDKEEKLALATQCFMDVYGIDTKKPDHVWMNASYICNQFIDKDILTMS